MLVIAKRINAKYKTFIIFFISFYIAIFRFFCCKIDAYKGSILVYFRYTCPNRQYIDLWMYVYVSRRSILQMYSNNILLDDRQVVLYIFIHIYMIWSVKYVYKSPY